MPSSSPRTHPFLEEGRDCNFNLYQWLQKLKEVRTCCSPLPPDAFPSMKKEIFFRGPCILQGTRGRDLPFLEEMDEPIIYDQHLPSVGPWVLSDAYHIDSRPGYREAHWNVVSLVAMVPENKKNVQRLYNCSLTCKYSIFYMSCLCTHIKLRT